MANLCSPKCMFFYAIQLMILMQAKVYCYWYKVGDLHAWGIPTSNYPNVYTKWSKSHNYLRVGDSLFFLYPPSEDSVLQVTPQAFKECNLKDPILAMNDGNSLFNITQPGEFYFVSGEPGRCQKGQKLQISLAGDGAIAYPPSPSGMADTAAGPSYANAFGSIPTASASSPIIRFSAFLASFIGFTIWVLA